MRTREPSTGRTYLAPFAEGLRPWLVVARNAIPVIGVYWFDWSAAIVVFQIWFDGVSGLGAMTALHMRAFVLTDPRARPPADIPPALSFLLGFIVLPLVWLVLLALLGSPYWFSLFFLSGSTLFKANFWTLVLGDTVIKTALLVALISNVIEHFRRDYERMSAREARLEFNWDFSMHLTRIAALMIVAFLFGRLIVIPLALALSYIEIYPMRSLRFLGGDRTLEPGNEGRSRD